VEELFQSFIQKSVSHNLSLVNDYEDRFIDHLRLCPIPPIF
jgi:hypothetical protein